MKTQWIPAGHHDILVESLEAGANASQIKELIPTRTLQAIRSRAKTVLGYSSKTENRVQRFIKDRTEDTETADEAAESLEGTTKLQSSESLSEKALKPIDLGLEANSIVIRMLQREQLPVNAKMVYKLSSYIEKALS